MLFIKNGEDFYSIDTMRRDQLQRLRGQFWNLHIYWVNLSYSKDHKIIIPGKLIEYLSQFKDCSHLIHEFTLASLLNAIKNYQQQLSTIYLITDTELHEKQKSTDEIEQPIKKHRIDSAQETTTTSAQETTTEIENQIPSAKELEDGLSKLDQILATRESTEAVKTTTGQYYLPNAGDLSKELKELEEIIFTADAEQSKTTSSSDLAPTMTFPGIGDFLNLFYQPTQPTNLDALITQNRLQNNTPDSITLHRILGTSIYIYGEIYESRGLFAIKKTLQRFLSPEVVNFCEWDSKNRIVKIDAKHLQGLELLDEITLELKLMVEQKKEQVVNLTSAADAETSKITRSSNSTPPRTFNIATIVNFPNLFHQPTQTNDPTNLKEQIRQNRLLNSTLNRITFTRVRGTNIYIYGDSNESKFPSSITTTLKRYLPAEIVNCCKWNHDNKIMEIDAKHLQGFELLDEITLELKLKLAQKKENVVVNRL